VFMGECDCVYGRVRLCLWASTAVLLGAITDATISEIQESQNGCAIVLIYLTYV
jgi:hypothetical protein